MRRRLVHDTSGNDCTSTWPSGLRTATAQLEIPRIITPSRTAWPPTGASRVASSGGACTREPTRWRLGARGRTAAPAPGRPPLEALNPSTRVDKLLLAGVEGMAG